jgi:hypothetical protein
MAFKVVLVQWDRGGFSLACFLHLVIHQTFFEIHIYVHPSPPCFPLFLSCARSDGRVLFDEWRRHGAW